MATDIKVKYQQGDTVYFLERNRIARATIQGLKVESDYGGNSYSGWGSQSFPLRIYYKLSDRTGVGYFHECLLYASSDELVADLLKNA